jgi:hypothetical protein
MPAAGGDKIRKKRLVKALRDNLKRRKAKDREPAHMGGTLDGGASPETGQAGQERKG